MRFLPCENATRARKRRYIRWFSFYRKHRSIRTIAIERSLRISRTMLRAFVTTMLSPQSLLVVALAADDRVEIFREKRKKRKEK